MKIKIFFPAVAATTVIAFLVSGCALPSFLSGSLSTKDITIKTQSNQEIKIHVEVANDQAKREKGLMERESLDDGKGMLFVFQDEGPRWFWMKNTKIPLDIVFLNGHKNIVQIVEDMIPCTTPTCITYPSQQPAMYAIELPVGFVKKNSVQIGDQVNGI